MRRILIALILAAAMLLSGAAAGSSSDPLVTKSWVDQYIAAQVDKLSSRLDAAEADLQSLLVVRLWIGRDYMEQNGEEIRLEAAPYVTAAGRSFVPLRVLGEAVGAEFLWDNEQKKVTYTLDGHRLELVLGSASIVADGNERQIDAPPESQNGRIFVPLRVVSENLGMAVTWVGTEKCAVVTACR